MSDRSERSRMENLFVDYIVLLRRSGLSWVTKETPKTAVYHVLSAIKPDIVKNRLKSDLDFAYNSLRKDFKGFMRHSIKVSEAFQLVDNGPKTKIDKSSSGKQASSSGRTIDSAQTQKEQKTKKDRKEKFIPPCPYAVCKKKSAKHWIDDCPETTAD